MTETVSAAVSRVRRSPTAPFPSPVDNELVRSPLARRRGAFAWSFIVLLLSDVVAVCMSAWICVQLSRSPESLAHISTLLGVAVAWLGMRFASGLYPGFGIAPPEALRLSVITTLVAAVAHSAAMVSLKMPVESRSVTVGTWFLLIPLAVLFRGLTKAILVRRGLFGNPVVVLGGGVTGAFAIRELHKAGGLGLVPVAVFDDDPEKHGSMIDGVPVLGCIESAVVWDAPYEVDHAVLAITGIGSRRLLELSEHISRRYKTVSIVADMLGLGSLWVAPQAFGRCLTLRVKSRRFYPRYLHVKRVTDLLIAVPAAIVSAPIIAVAAALVAILDRGAPFYYQNREGLNGERIKVWKIRTMVRDAERRLHDYLEMDEQARAEWERSMKLRSDPRIIPLIGSFLRRSSIDELPQLWSVLTGTMSLVGPRPLPDYHLARFDKEFLDLRRQVKPGISGYWQVTDRSDSDLEQQQAADRYYIQNWSLWLDLWVLFRTAEAVVSRRGAA
jgi:Undecaprenyl-phosphate galactose phosphotransferase WbaP